MANQLVGEFDMVREGSGIFPREGLRELRKTWSYRQKKKKKQGESTLSH